MKKQLDSRWLALFLCLPLLTSLSLLASEPPPAPASRLPGWTEPDSKVPEATSLLGQPLYQPQIPPEQRARLEEAIARARADFIKNPLDADANWFPAGTGILNSVQQGGLIIDPTAPSTLYVVSGFTVLKTTNGAASWTLANSGLELEIVRCIALDPLAPTTLYAGTVTGIFKTTNAGGNWALVSELGSGGPSSGGLPRDLEVVALAVDPQNAGVLYVGLGNTGVFKSTDGGTTWTAANAGMAPATRALVVDPVTPSTVYAATILFEAFVSKVAAAGSPLLFSTFLGGIGTEIARAVALDPQDNIYVTGETFSGDFPTANALQPSCASCEDGGADIFVAKLNASGTALLYSSFLGGRFGEAAGSVVVNATGVAHLAGSTASPDFPLLNPIQSSCPTVAGTILCDTSFVAALAPDGQQLLFSTYFGDTSGSGRTFSRGIGLDAEGGVYVAGFTSSSDLPIVSAFQSSYGGGTFDAFVAHITEPFPEDYSLTAAPAGQTVMAGQSTTFTVTTTPGPEGFSRAVTFSVSGLPERTSWRFDPNPVTPGSSTVNSTLTITTQAAIGGASVPPLPTGGPGNFEALWLLAAGLALASFAMLRTMGRRGRRLAWRTSTALALVLLLVFLQIGCAQFQFLEPRGGTPAGTYTLTITATSGALQRSTTATLVVQ